LQYPSAGSFFKRPQGYFAGALIEQCGLKGFAVGGAMVSEKHAGFVVNTGEATASDIVALAETVIDRVKSETGVTLEPEVRYIGEPKWKLSL
jgi:UDP-N-acetylmuramate dehydrogenase